MSSKLLLQLATLTYIVSVFPQYQYLLVEVGDKDNEKPYNTISNQDPIPSNDSSSSSNKQENWRNKLQNIEFRKDSKKPTKKPAPKNSKST